MSNEATGQQVVRLILRHFAGLRDPRAARTRRYALQHVLAMALCAVLMGADGFAAIALFVKDRRRLFEGWLEADFGEGTPCADTFRRVFGALCPQGFERAFRHFIAALAASLQGQVVALDGKAVRGALQPGRGPLHLVHVWAVEQRLLLGQRRVEGAPGEVAGLVELIDALALEGACVTADANGCTESVAAACTRAQADYVLCLKGNRGPLHDFACSLFVLLAWQKRLPRGTRRVHRTARHYAHGRYEVREAWALSPDAWPCTPTSPACRPTHTTWLRPSASTGAWKMACTGASTCRWVRTGDACARRAPPKTSPSSPASPSSSSNRTKAYASALPSSAPMPPATAAT